MNQVVADLIMNPLPPTLYSIMNSMANYDKEEKTKIRKLAEATHEKIFDFDYTLSSNINKDEFEISILNHFIMRRIGFETFTAFQLFLENKLVEILPYYNILFDALSNYNLFNDGEVITRNLRENGTSNVNTTSNLESRYSEYPLDRLNDLRNGSYVSNQTVNDGTSNNTGTTSNTQVETTSRTPIEKMDLYMKYLETKNSIMTRIYKELEILFYGLGD